MNALITFRIEQIWNRLENEIQKVDQVSTDGEVESSSSSSKEVSEPAAKRQKVEQTTCNVQAIFLAALDKNITEAVYLSIKRLMAMDIGVLECDKALWLLQVITKDKGVSMATFLFKHYKVSVNGVPGDDNSPLHLAARKNNYPLILKLLEWGANPLYQDQSGNTFLHIIAREARGHFEPLKQAVIARGFDPDSVCNLQGFTPTEQSLSMRRQMTVGNLATLDQQYMFL